MKQNCNKHNIIITEKITDMENKTEPEQRNDVAEVTGEWRLVPGSTLLLFLCNKPAYLAEFRILRIRYLAR